jgi:hypothetical protein
MSYADALQRSLLVWYRGLGMGLPLVYFATWYKGQETLTSKGITTWDRDCGTDVHHEDLGAIRVAVAVAAIAASLMAFTPFSESCNEYFGGSKARIAVAADNPKAPVALPAANAKAPVTIPTNNAQEPVYTAADLAKAAVKMAADDAKAKNSPAGVFGTTWLMSRAMVKDAVPNAVVVGNELIEMRKVYNRDAKVIYSFNDDYLLQVIVSFTGPSTRAQYDDIQKKLIVDYGAMPKPHNAENPSRLSSEKFIGRFDVENIMYAVLGVQIEQVIYCRAPK